MATEVNACRRRVVVGVVALAAMLLPGAALDAQSPSSPPPEVRLSLSEALSRALANNLALRALRADTGGAVGQLIGSRLRPNPALAVEYQTTGDRTASDMSVSLTQDVPLWGVRANRVRAANMRLDAARYAALDAARRVRRDVAASYRTLLFQDQRVMLLDSLARVNGRIARAAQLAFAQGLGSELDVRLSEAAWRQSALDQDRALREYAIQQVEFARLLGDGFTTTYALTDSLTPAGVRFLTVSATTGAPEGVHYTPDEAAVDSFIQLALAERPDVRAAESEREAQGASMAAARGAGRPTLALGAFYTRRRDTFTLGAQAGSVADRFIGLGAVIGLPFFSRNQGEVAQAGFAEVAAGLRLADARQRVERDVRVAVQQVALAASAMETLRQTILPANTGALRIVETAFSRGQANIFQVLQVQRAYVESTTGLLDAMRQYAEALGDLEAALGNPLP